LKEIVHLPELAEFFEGNGKPKKMDPEIIGYLEEIKNLYDSLIRSD